MLPKYRIQADLGMKQPHFQLAQQVRYAHHCFVHDINLRKFEL